MAYYIRSRNVDEKRYNFVYSTWKFLEVFAAGSSCKAVVEIAKYYIKYLNLTVYLGREQRIIKQKQEFILQEAKGRQHKG